MKNTRDKYYKIFEKELDSILVLDTQMFKIQDFNPAAINMFGYSKEEFLKLDILNLSVEREKMEGFIREFAKDDKALLPLCHLKRNDGTVFPAEGTGGVFAFEGKRKIFVIIRDITERRRTEEERNKLLYEMHEHMKELECLSQITAIAKDPDISLNDMLKEIVYTLPPAWRYPDLASARIVFSGQEFKTSNFKETKYELFSDLIVFGEKIGIVEVCYHDDIREELGIDESLFLKEEETLIDVVGGHLCRLIEYKQQEERSKRSYYIQTVLNKLLSISLLNISLEEMFKRIISLITSISWLTLEEKGVIFLVDDDRPNLLVLKAQQGLDKVLQTKCAFLPFGTCLCGQAAKTKRSIFSDKIDQHHEYKYKGMADHGHYCVPILSSTSKVLGVFTIYVKAGHLYNEREVEFLNTVVNAIAGIIERKNMEEKLLEYNEKLRKLDQLKSDFVSTVSHELRSPLSIIKEGISLVLDEVSGEINEAQKKVLKMGKDNVDCLTRIINDLLDISKIEAGKIDFRKVLVDLSEIVRDIGTKWKLESDKKQQALNVNVPEVPVNVYIDVDKIIQVLNNLISNAIKYTPEEGRIRVDLKDKERDIEVSVSDTGFGISKEDLPKAFGKFQQFHRIRGPGPKGTGLGLAISKELIKMHGGDIKVESVVGKGSKFTFFLPKMNAEDAFNEYVIRKIQEVEQRRVPLSLVSIRVLLFGKLRDKIGQKEAHSLMNAVEKMIKDSLHRQEDVVMRDGGEFVVLLIDTKKDGALIVEKRIGKAINEYMSEEKDGLSSEVNIVVGSSVYPGEAATAVDLLNQARIAALSIIK